MSKRLKIEITVDYEDNVTERDRVYVDKLIDELLKHVDFQTPDNALDTDIPDPVRYSVTS